MGDELVALDVDAGQCFGFNAVAADIWRLLEHPRDFDELHRLMVERYDVEPGQCAAELETCLAELADQKLVVAEAQA